jgi:hypothetical protein
MVRVRRLAEFPSTTRPQFMLTHQARDEVAANAELP